jgi:hypothetical protein
MPVSELVEEASLFAAAAFLLALATVWLRRDLRKGTMRMAFVMPSARGAGAGRALRRRRARGRSGVMREAALAILTVAPRESPSRSRSVPCWERSPYRKSSPKC